MRSQVTGRHQPGERLVEVAREHLAVGAEVDGVATRGVAALTACPHGLPREATTAPGKVLSSLAFSTFADSQYADRSRSVSARSGPGGRRRGVQPLS